tara:strand:- start:350 stop:484 length:135 start_codon:yes stop_codon:yes gene_type:complete
VKKIPEINLNLFEMLKINKEQKKMAKKVFPILGIFISVSVGLTA